MLKVCAWRRKAGLRCHAPVSRVFPEAILLSQIRVDSLHCYVGRYYAKRNSYVRSHFAGTREFGRWRQAWLRHHGGHPNLCGSPPGARNLIRRDHAPRGTRLDSWLGVDRPSPTVSVNGRRPTPPARRTGRSRPIGESGAAAAEARMNKIVHFAVRLYPSKWRARYGHEFDALLEDINAGFGDLVNIVKGALITQLSRSNVPLMAGACGLLGLLVAAMMFLASPGRKTYTASIDIEGRSSPGLPSSVGVLASRAFSNAALRSIIEQFDLYPSERKRLPIIDVVHRFREDISFRPNPDLLKLSFSYPDHRKAEKVLGKLVDRFIEEGFSYRIPEVTPETVNRQIPPGDRSPLGFTNLHVKALPHPVSACANLIEILGLGFGGGALAGVAIALLRHRIQPSA